MNDLPHTAAPATKPAQTPIARRLLLGAAFAGALLAGGLIGSGAPALAFEMAMDHADMDHMGHGGMPGMDHMGRERLDRMLTEAGASADQKTKIHAIMKTAFA